MGRNILFVVDSHAVLYGQEFKTSLSNGSHYISLCYVFAKMKSPRNRECMNCARLLEVKLEYCPCVLFGAWSVLLSLLLFSVEQRKGKLLLVQACTDWAHLVV